MFRKNVLDWRPQPLRHQSLPFHSDISTFDGIPVLPHELLVAGHVFTKLSKSMVKPGSSGILFWLAFMYTTHMGILYHRSIVLHFKTINAWTGWYLCFLLHTTDGCSCLLLRRLPQVHLQHLVWLVGSYVGIYMGSSEDNGLGFYYVNIFCNGFSVLLSKLLFSRGSGYYERGRNYYIHC